MKLPVLAVLTALVFAGCVAPGTTLDSSGGLPADLAGVPALVHKVGDTVGLPLPGVVPALFYIGHEAAEPTIAITKDGTLFYAAATFTNDVAGVPIPLPRTDILRSADGGATWEDVTPRVGPVRTHFDTGDPYVYVDPATDRVFDLDQRFAVGQYSISWSDDKGQTWKGPVFLCDAPPCDHQTITAFKPRVALPTYPSHVMVCYNQIAAVACKLSPDGGAAWTRAAPPFLGAGPEGFCGGLHGHLKSGSDGVVYLPKEHCGKPMVAVTTDGGLSWRRAEIPGPKPSPGPDPAVAVDEAGNAYYTYVDEDGRLMLSVSTDQGATWSEAMDVTAPGFTATHLPAIAAGADGKVVIAYAATDDPDGFEQDVSASKANAVWHVYLTTIEGATGESPTLTTIRVNPADDPVVRGRCGPGRCPALYDFIDVDIDADGRPWAAYSDACIEKCVTDPKGKNNAREGFVGTLREGFSLRADGPLPPIHGAAQVK